jgi:hypothetical protein
VIKTLGAIILFGVAIGTSAGARQVRYLPDAAGTWKPWVFTAAAGNRDRVAARATDVKALETQLLALNAIIRKTSGFAAPIGFSVETAGDLDLESYRAGQPPLATLPLPATLNFGAYGIHEIQRNGKPVRADTGETAQLLFFVNQLALPLFFGRDPLPEFQDVETDVTLLAASQPDLFGIPRYGHTLVLKKNPAPIWIAVSLEESLRLAASGITRRVRTARDVAARLRTQHDELTNPGRRAQRIAEYKKLATMSKDPDYLDKMMKVEQRMEANVAALLEPIKVADAQVAAIERDLTAANAALAALPAASRAAPACYASQERSSLSRFRNNPDRNCIAIVRPNWKLFNPALPRSAPQVVVIAHFERCLTSDQPALHAGGCSANRKLLEAIDTQSIYSWLQ